MTKTLTGTLQGRIDWVYRNTDLLSAVQDSSNVNASRAFTSGTGQLQADLMYRAERIVTLASPEDLIDLSGVLVDVFGEALTFTKIKALLIENRGLESAGTYTPTPGEDLLVGGAGSGTAWRTLLNGNATAKITVRSGGVLLLTAPYDGYSVVAGTQDMLRVYHDGSAASGGDIAYRIVIIGN